MTTPQWAPTEVLELDPNSSNFTCVGYAKSKNRRCRNPIACANRQEATKILLEISRLDPQSQSLENKLEELASRLLCRRWHQDQAAQVKRHWHRQIETTRLAEELGGRNNNEPNEEEPIIMPDASLREQTAVAREEGTDEGEPEGHVLHVATQEPPQEEPLHAHDRRAIEGDCAICCEDLSSDGPIVWCRAQCRQNFHADCIDLWHAALEAEGRMKTCPYCRTEWAE